MESFPRMRKHTFFFRIISPMIVIIALLGIVLGALYFHGGTTHAASSYTSHPILVHPIYQEEGPTSQRAAFQCQTTNPAGCYGPKQIRIAYVIHPTLTTGITTPARPDFFRDDLTC